MKTDDIIRREAIEALTAAPGAVDAEAVFDMTERQ